MPEEAHNISTTFELNLLHDFAVSDWLKNQIVETQKRDVLDALRDAELLLQVLELRCMECGIIERQ